MPASTVSLGNRLLLGALVLVIAGCTGTQNVPVTPPPSSSAVSSSTPSSGIDILADHLAIPWDIAFLPDGDLLATLRPGSLIRIGKDKKTYPIGGVKHIGEGGLLGIALHPDFASNHWLYLYLTTAAGAGTVNRVERYRYENDALTDRTEILTGIPGSQYHDGGRIVFGPDGLLYITTGDAQHSDLAQRKDSLAGKILRLNDDGSIPADNPFGTAVYSYGHRNPQGLAWDNQGRLWATEHGRSPSERLDGRAGAATGYDELNLIEKGANYGWPTIQGPETKQGMRSPALQSGPTTTWAPASAAYHNGSIFFGGLKGATLYEAVIPSDISIAPELRSHFTGQFGRIRTVRFGPDGFLYLTTSNTDGRGTPVEDDDRIIRIDPALL